MPISPHRCRCRFCLENLIWSNIAVVVTAKKKSRNLACNDCGWAGTGYPLTKHDEHDDYSQKTSGTKKEPKPKVLSRDIFWWGGGLPREGVGAKKFGMSLETQGIKLFWRDIPGFCNFGLIFLRSRPGKPNQRKGQNEKFMNFAHFCEFWCFSLGKQARFTLNLCSGMPLRDIPGFCRDIPEVPEKFEKNMFGFNSRPLYLWLLQKGFWGPLYQHRIKAWFEIPLTIQRGHSGRM